MGILVYMYNTFRLYLPGCQ